MKHPLWAAALACLFSATLVATGASAANAAGSDGPIPYTVTADGLTLAAGDTFPDGGHVNIRYTVDGGAEQGAGVHFEALNNQPSGVFIGTSYLPWSYLIPDSQYCITWVQVSLYNEHFGEGGQAPVCFGTPTPPTTVETGSATFETLTCDTSTRNWMTLPAVKGGIWTTRKGATSTALPIGTGYTGAPTDGAGNYTVALTDGDSSDAYTVTPWSGAWTATDAATLTCAPVQPPAKTGSDVAYAADCASTLTTTTTAWTQPYVLESGAYVLGAKSYSAPVVSTSTATESQLAALGVSVPADCATTVIPPTTSTPTPTPTPTPRVTPSPVSASPAVLAPRVTPVVLGTPPTTTTKAVSAPVVAAPTTGQPTELASTGLGSSTPIAAVASGAALLLGLALVAAARRRRRQAR